MQLSLVATARKLLIYFLDAPRDPQRSLGGPWGNTGVVPGRSFG